MSLLQLFSILRARRGAAALILLATLALGLAWVMLRPPSYTARAPVLIDVRTDPVNATPLQGMVAPSFVATQIDVIKSDRVADRVVKMLPADLPLMVALREMAQQKSLPPAWIAQQLKQPLEVKPARESNIISISWTGSTPEEAAQVANAFSQAYLDTNLEIRTDPARKYADWFETQVKESRDRLEKAQTRMSEFQQKSGIISSDERSDYETTRLKDLSQQLMIAQGRGVGSAAASSDASPLVSNLRQEMARMEAKVGEAGATMGANHPAMQKLQGELSAMRSRVAQESSRVGASGASSAQASRQRERELQNAIAQQRNRVLSLNKERGELAVMQREVDSAQKAYETVSASSAQSRLQAMSTQTNVMRLAPAIEPLEATGPRKSIAMLVAALVGTLLAIAGALLLELINRRVRSASDLSSVTQLPILASVPASSRAIVALRAPPRRLALASRGSPA